MQQQFIYWNKKFKLELAFKIRKVSPFIQLRNI